jgi:hypothetical protein
MRLTSSHLELPGDTDQLQKAAQPVDLGHATSVIGQVIPGAGVARVTMRSKRRLAVRKNASCREPENGPHSPVRYAHCRRLLEARRLSEL